MRNVQAAKALGVFGIGLGMVELCAPRWLGRAVGAGERSPRLVRAFGLREIAAGVAILARRRKASGLWARAIGDLFDLTGLIAALRRSTRRGRTALALAAVVGASALDVTFARRLGRSRLAGLLPT
jgi:hypothetical protein